VGAEVQPGGGVHFRVWAPKRKKVEVIFTSGEAVSPLELEAEEDGYFSGFSAEAKAGALYRLRLDGDDDCAYPDPASRFQPEGPHGPSRIVDPSSFRWTDDAWKGRSLTGQIVYEMHIGTFTREGTWAAAARELPSLADLGVTVIEMMPVADFPGRFGWGYDGVNLFAPTRLYGEPDDLRRFVDEAHRHGIAVILDVVHNHFGPDGNYICHFSDDYTTDRYKNEWGEAINFDGPNCERVREFFIANAGYWIDEYHFDGLRLDATQQIFDSSSTHILTEIERRVRAAANGRASIIICENEPQETRMVRPIERGGYGLDGLWNDDFHHSAVVVLTGHNEAYYTDYLGTPQEFISAAKYGYLYQGQRYRWQKARRGTPTFDLLPEVFVTFIENHDQVANTARGDRLHRRASPGRMRAMTALLLLGPGTPMLFQGQEFASSAPFLYFADHVSNIAEKVCAGRTDFMCQFPRIATPEGRSCLALPHAAETFERCKLDHEERVRHREAYELHRDLIRLRREDPVLSLRRRRGLDGAVLGPEAFVLRFFSDDGADRLLLVNFGTDLHLYVAPEPLLAPPEASVWRVLWSSEAIKYGGLGTPPLETEEGWLVPGGAAVVLAPEPSSDASSEDRADKSGEAEPNESSSAAGEGVPAKEGEADARG
jgi:maltooligosyltrehalose trehalohydrolase